MCVCLLARLFVTVVAFVVVAVVVLVVIVVVVIVIAVSVVAVVMEKGKVVVIVGRVLFLSFLLLSLVDVVT